jgi:hypothetical protein
MLAAADHTAKHIAMTGQKLGSAVNYHINPKGKGILI